MNNERLLPLGVGNQFAPSRNFSFNDCNVIVPVVSGVQLRQSRVRRDGDGEVLRHRRRRRPRRLHPVAQDVDARILTLCETHL